MAYTKYYKNPSGYGLGNVGAIYRTPHIIQSGHGIGSLFAGLGKYLKPLFISGLDALELDENRRNSL